MRASLGPLLLAWTLACAVCAPLSASAQAVEAAAGSSDALSVELLKDRADEAAASAALNDADKSALAELYSKAISSLETAASHREAARRFESAIETSNAAAARIRAELDAAQQTEDRAAFDLDGVTLPEIEQQLQRERAKLAVIEARLTELQSQIAEETDRPAAIRKRLTEAQGQTAQLVSHLAAQTPGDELAELTQARRWAQQGRLEQLRAETLMLEQELASQPMRLDLLRARRDQADLQLAVVAQGIALLEGAANKVRLQETELAKSEARAAEREAASQHPLLAELAAKNTRLTEELDRLAGAIEGINREEAAAAQEAKRIEESYSTTRQKLDIAGLSPVLGQVLLEQLRSLPATDRFRKKASERERQIAEASLSQVQLEEERGRLRNLAGYVQALTADLPPEQRAEVGEQLTALATSRRELIDKALAVQRVYLQAMGQLDITQRRLQDAAAQFRAFLDKRLLWVRSTEVAGPELLGQIPRQVLELAAPGKWLDLAQRLLRDVATSPLMVLALLFALWRSLARRRLWTALRDSGKHVGNPLQDRVSDTLRAFGIIVLMALPWPLLMFVVGTALRSAYDTSDFDKRVGYVLLSLAPLLFQLSALRTFVAPGSVASVHFRWRDAGVQRLHRDLLWFAPILLGSAFITMLALRSPQLGAESGLGRVLFLILMGIFAVFFYRLSKPDTGTICVLTGHNRDSRAFRLRHLWFLLLVGPPIGAAIVTIAGYLYTAGTLIQQILQSAWFALFVIVVHQLILRWLVLNERRLRLEAARARRRAEQEARLAKESLEDAEGIPARDIEEPEIDFKALDATSRKLLNNAMLLAGLIGIWAIWRDVLPALGILDDVTLWSYSKTGVEEPIPITLSSLGLALLVLAVTVIATRQLPAFLEIALLQRLGMSQGSRYTVITLTRYTLVAVGVAWIFGFLGGSWSEIQWIFAALGVGIGFGLQEIVANFISGLIILFERPIRIGDVVTVGNTDGVVTRIQIRATTIRNWDRKELLVPNKNFITQELLNWSLSDQTTRILIRVGIAYGSDVERAMLIMEQAAADHARVLADPPPFVVFEEFGDNALLLSLRCYIDDIDYRLRTMTDMNLAINRGLAEAGIEIAFPQRDIHLDTRRPLEVRLQRERK